MDVSAAKHHDPLFEIVAETATAQPGGEASPEYQPDSLVMESAFRGEFPEVATADGIDMASLTDGDDSPFFVTLPVAETGAISKNGLLYDPELMDSIERQIKDKRVGGIFGHLAEADRSTKYPQESVFWVGAARHGKTLWAKGYVPPGDARERIRRMKALNRRIGTSIYGRARFVPEGEHRRAVNFDLESLDFAPPERAALMVPGPMAITAETEQEPANAGEGEPMKTKQELLAELTAADAGLLPEAVRAAVLEAAEETNQVTALVAELREQIASAENANAETLSELTAAREELAELRNAQFARQVADTVAEYTDWPATDDEAIKRLETLRKAFTRAVVAEMAGERDAETLATKAKELWESEFQALAEAVRDTLSGPPAPNTAVNTDKTLIETLIEKYSDPAQQQAAASRLGL